MSLDIARIQRDYGDPQAEARACRTSAALFDFSFVSRARVDGPGALKAMAAITDRRLADMRPGDIRYSLRCNAAGHLVCDLTVWRLGGESWEVMSGRHRDIADLAAAAGSGAHITDLSSASVILAVQGPGALATIARVSDASPLARLDYFKHGAATVAGIPCHVGRLGYTGEQGFEIIAPRDAGPALWQALSGSARPAGFTAADMLRIEAGFILFTNELAVPVTPTEAGVDRYAGEAGALGVAEITLVCLTAAEREIELPWQARWPLQRPAREGEVTVTSACRSPLADGLLLLGYARTRDLANGVMLRDAAGHFTGLRRVSLPFYDPQKRRPRAPLVP